MANQNTTTSLASITTDSTKNVVLDATAYFSSRQNPIQFLDEIVINGITGETFFNGENN